MFNKFFRKNKESKNTAETEGNSQDPKEIAFSLLILTYLEKNGIDGKGNKSLPIQELNEEDKDWINKTQDLLGFADNIEDIIITDWESKKNEDKTLTPKDFLKVFLTEFHNSKVETFAPDFVKERNKKFIEAYQNTIKTIERIQGWLDDETLRTKIESDFREKPKIQSTIFQCTTPFCIVSLGCDQMGRYNLVYSVDYRFQEMISELFASTLIRRIYQFTPGEMEPFVKIGSLYTDCMEIFNKMIDETKIEPYHKVTIQPRNGKDE